MKRDCYVAVLAAGLGKRMQSSFPKVLHPILGRPMLQFVLDALAPFRFEERFIIVGHQAEKVRKVAGEEYSFVLQAEQRGTGHAVAQLSPFLGGKDGVLLVVPGDMPLLRPDHITKVFAKAEESDAAAVVLTAEVADPATLGRVSRSEKNEFIEIVEEADASEAIRVIKEVCTSVYAFSLPRLFSYLQQVEANNLQREHYLTAVLPLMKTEGCVEIVKVSDIPYVGVNDRIQLLKCQASLRLALFDRLMRAGVTLEDAGTIFIDWDVRIGKDTVIKPFTMIEGRSLIGEKCVLGPFLWLKDAEVGDEEILFGRVERSL